METASIFWNTLFPNQCEVLATELIQKMAKTLYPKCYEKGSVWVGLLIATMNQMILIKDIHDKTMIRKESFLALFDCFAFSSTMIQRVDLILRSLFGDDIRVVTNPNDEKTKKPILIRSIPQLFIGVQSSFPSKDHSYVMIDESSKSLYFYDGYKAYPILIYLSQQHKLHWVLKYEKKEFSCSNLTYLLMKYKNETKISPKKHLIPKDSNIFFYLNTFCGYFDLSGRKPRWVYYDKQMFLYKEYHNPKIAFDIETNFFNCYITE
jgi:hypothetical protein